MIHRLAVSAEQDGERLDRLLAAALPDLSRSLIQKHIDAGAVSVNGALPRRGPSTAVKAGDQITYRPPEPTPVELLPEAIPLSILYQDDDLVVLDKQAGLVVHPAAGHWSGTLVNALLGGVAGFTGIGGELRPGIVHRLDRGTSGVMVVAKHDRAQRALAAQFKARQVEKHYLAVVWGAPHPRAGTIDTFFGRHPTDRKRFSSKLKSGEKRAITHYTTARRLGRATLLEIRLETGRTHQIRVHLADRGHPLLGDRVYGARRPPAGIDRPALHARRLVFTHPSRIERMSFEAPIPADLQRLIDALAGEPGAQPDPSRTPNRSR